MATPISTMTEDELRQRALRARRLAREHVRQPQINKQLLDYATEAEDELRRRQRGDDGRHPF